MIENTLLLIIITLFTKYIEFNAILRIKLI